jgi:hypothetical protein
MVLRETTFLLGGALTIGLGVALAAGLVWAGAGAAYFSAYIGCGLAVLLGSFFLYVGSAEGRERRAFLADTEPAADGGTSGPDRRS